MTERGWDLFIYSWRFWRQTRRTYGDKMAFSVTRFCGMTFIVNSRTENWLGERYWCSPLTKFDFSHACYNSSTICPFRRYNNGVVKVHNLYFWYKWLRIYFTKWPLSIETRPNSNSVDVFPYLVSSPLVAYYHIILLDLTKLAGIYFLFINMSKVSLNLWRHHWRKGLELLRFVQLLLNTSLKITTLKRM